MRKCNCKCKCRNRNTNIFPTCPMQTTRECHSNPFPNNYLYGYAYTPNQTIKETFCPRDGLRNGSMFPELVSPYYPGQSIDFIEYLKTTDRNGGCGCE